SLHSLESIRAFRHNLDRGFIRGAAAAEILAQNSASQFLVVCDHCLQPSFSQNTLAGTVNVTRYTSSLASISRRPAFPYRASSRWRTFARPIPRRLEGASGSYGFSIVNLSPSLTRLPSI